MLTLRHLALLLLFLAPIQYGTHQTLHPNALEVERQHSPPPFKVLSPSVDSLGSQHSHRSQDDEQSPDRMSSPPHVDWTTQIGVSRILTLHMYHPDINGKICDKDGNELPACTPPLPPSGLRLLLLTMTNHHFQKRHKCTTQSTKFLLERSNGNPSRYNLTELDFVPSWMEGDYDVWFRDPRILVHNLLSNLDFKKGIDLAPFQERLSSGVRRFQNFMSGIWAWRQTDPETHGSVFCPIILGSDKTTVSVGTGNNAYWPVCLSIGNIHNNVRRVHRNGVILLGFLAIPKTSHEFRNDVAFRKFRRQLLHSSLAAKILETLKRGMTTPEVFRFADDHFRKVVYGLGPYIADYPEQPGATCLYYCACKRPRFQKIWAPFKVEGFELGPLWDEYGLVDDVIMVNPSATHGYAVYRTVLVLRLQSVNPFTDGFPRADIYELLSLDLLHQLKGAFRDHLVTWVSDWVKAEYPAKEANRIFDDVDRRIPIAPSFAGLRRFPLRRLHKRDVNRKKGDVTKHQSIRPVSRYKEAFSCCTRDIQSPARNRAKPANTSESLQTLSSPSTSQLKGRLKAEASEKEVNDKIWDSINHLVTKRAACSYFTNATCKKS
ncbi:hypothetical protein EDB83DRAFT_2322883 [Lactarius deliciosus]|nr:hypothetical protein EDB83DRAFT_2322883 [Lactarius deliciosus]